MGAKMLIGSCPSFNFINQGPSVLYQSRLPVSPSTTPNPSLILIICSGSYYHSLPPRQIYSLSFMLNNPVFTRPVYTSPEPHERHYTRILIDYPFRRNRPAVWQLAQYVPHSLQNNTGRLTACPTFSASY